MDKSNHIILHHLLNGGRIEKLGKDLGVSKSVVHRVLDKYKKDGVYDWSINKEGGYYSELIELFGMDILKFITSLAKEGQKVVESEIKSYRKIVVLPDIHYPENISLTGIEKFLAEYQPNVLIYLGDVMELDYLSFFQKDNKTIVADKLRKEYDEVMKFMDRQIELSKATEVYYIEGNHEYRVKRTLEAHPEGTGFIEIPIGMKLKERGIKWEELNTFVKLGKLFFTHGLFWNVYHARQHLDKYQRNIVYGHTHAIQVHSGYHPYDKNLPHIAKSIGCLCTLNPTFLKKRPNQWINSFYIAEIEESGVFHDNIVTIVNDEFRIVGTAKRYQC